MICPNCNEQVPKGTKFCPACGTKLPQEEKTRAEEAKENFPKQLAFFAALLLCQEAVSGVKTVSLEKDIPASDIARFKDVKRDETPKILICGSGFFSFDTGFLFTDKKLHFIAKDVRTFGGFFGGGKKLEGSVLLRSHKFTLGDEIEVGSPPAYQGNEFYIDGNFKGWVKTDNMPCLSFISRSTKGEIFCRMVFDFINKFNKENPLV